MGVNLYYFSIFTSYAIDIGPRILEYYESYFNIDYPLKKQDMAAIPDFAAGRLFNLLLIVKEISYDS